MKNIHKITFILLALGGLNWLLVGIVNYDLVDSLLGGFAGGLVATIVYVLIGLSAIYEVATHKKNCTNCSASGPSAPQTGV